MIMVPLDQVTKILLCNNNIINPESVKPLYSPDLNPSISIINKFNIKWSILPFQQTNINYYL